MRSKRIHAVIDMKYCDLSKSKHLIKVLEYSFIIMYQIISGIIHVAGIKAYPEPLFFMNPLINPGKLLKASADLTALAGHGFQCDENIVLILIQHLI